ncbi:hypothetical protein D3C73_1470040 [compost metagenome]
MRKDLFEIAVAALALGGVGMNDIGIGRDAGHRQVVVAEGVADLCAFLRGQLPRAELHVLEMQVQLHGVEAV